MTGSLTARMPKNVDATAAPVNLGCARPYQICSRCVMDTTDPLITFDEDGHCNHCTDYFRTRIALVNRDLSGEALEQVFAVIKSRGAGKRYDCAVGLSGGVDSSYVAYLARRAGLRVLGVHLDNGWDSPVAVENVKNIVRRLNIDYAAYVLPWNDFRRVQVAFLRASVPEAETPTDVAIQRAVHKLALERGAGSILSGGNIATEGILPVTWHYNARDTKYSHAILKANRCPRTLFRSQKFGVLDEVYAKVLRGVRTYYPLNSVAYNKDTARTALESVAGWRYYGSKHGESRFTKFIQTYYLPVKHGIDYRRATLSSEICLGQVTREQALEVLRSKPYQDAEVEIELQYVAKKLAISLEELRDIIAQPPRWFWSYPNNQKVLGMIYDAYRSLAGQKKTSNF